MLCAYAAHGVCALQISSYNIDYNLSHGSTLGLEGPTKKLCLQQKATIYKCRLSKDTLLLFQIS